MKPTVPFISDWQRELVKSPRCIMPYLYTRVSIYCHLVMCVTVASVSSHLVVRPRRFLKIKEKKMKMKINNDLAILASQYLEGRFMTGTCCREIVFEMNRQSLWLDHLRARCTLSTSSQPASSPLYTFPETPSFSGISSPASWSSGYLLLSPLRSAPMPLVLNIVPVLHPWSVIYLYLCDVRLLTLHRELVSWGCFLLRQHIQRGELLLITIWDDPSKGYYEG